MSIQSTSIYCIFVVILLPDWLSSAEFHSPANLLDRHYVTYTKEYPYEDMEVPLLEPERIRPHSRQKRLMGIFRCNGWGPGCTQFEGGNEGGAGGGGRGHGHERHYHGGETGSNRSPIEKFQPFFTLTSGGSWGPTGKRAKPSLGRHHVAKRYPEIYIGRDVTDDSYLKDYMAKKHKSAQKREKLLLDTLKRFLNEIKLKRK